MNKIGYFIATIVLSICLIGFSACGGNNKDKTVQNAQTTDLKEFYHITETIDFDAVKIKVTYKDKTTAELTKGEVDIDIADAKADTQFVLNTDGLSTQSGGELTEGEYKITCQIVGDKENKKYDLITINVSTSMAIIYDLTSFDAPEFVTTFKENNKASVNDESAFYKTTDYYVGDDNAFEFKPTLQLISKDGSTFTSTTDFKANVKVEIKGADAFNEVSVTNNTYFDYHNFEFMFKETAIGQTFRVTMTPVDFTEDYAGNQVQPVTFTFKVADGYNIYNAIDLGRINLFSNTVKSEINANSDSWSREDKSWARFYDPATGSHNLKKSYNDMWKTFLLSKGATDLAPINGVFLHQNISVTPNDLPSEYFISEDEVNSSQSKAVGTLRDRAELYTHYLENDFTFNGNLFKIDFASIPWGRSNSDYNGFYFPDEGAETHATPGHSTAFVMANKSDESNADKKVYFINTELVGNTANAQLDANKGEALLAAGGLIMIKSITTTTVAENCIAKGWMIAWFAEYTTNINALEINYVKTYDCFNSGIYNYGSEMNTIANSEFKRFGGPVILATSISSSSGDKEHGVGFTIDKNTTTLESYVSGTEAWFTIVGASSIVTPFFDLDQLLNYYGATVLEQQGNNKYMNMIAISLDSGTVTSSKPTYSSINYGGNTYALNNEATNPVAQIWSNAGSTKPPVFITSSGQVAYMPSQTSLQFVLPSSDQTKLSGDALFIAYPMNATASAGVLVDLKPYQAT